MERTPTAFISYAWENEDIKLWVKSLATRLRENGIDAKLDLWELLPGSQLTHFMERSVRENDFVLIVCTPAYRTKSDYRTGGVGYEGDIMTAEVLAKSNHTKFIPILKSGEVETSMPTWLKGSYYIDLSNEQHYENNFNDLLTTLLSVREKAPPIGKPQQDNKRDVAILSRAISEEEPIKVRGILVNEVSQPKNDGTYGSALYRIPFELNRSPSYEWVKLFISAWDRPSSFTSMHRPGIASVQGNKIILDGTEIEEVEKFHKATLMSAVSYANTTLKEIHDERNRIEEQKNREQEMIRKKVKDISDRMRFDE